MSNCLIVGASSGIGQAIAMQLATAGMNVYGTYYKNEITSEHP